MRWIVGIIILLECLYQLFGVSISVNWSIFYELVRYLGLGCIALLYAYENWDRLMFYFSMFFLFMTGVVFSHLGMTRCEYLESNRVSSVYYIGLITIFVLLLFITNKKWKNSKKTGK